MTWTNADVLAIAKPQIEADEGCRLVAYPDTLGIYTIGYGHAHVAKGTVWTQAQADTSFDADLFNAMHDLDFRLAWWRELDVVRAAVLLNMAFNMGVESLLGFHNTLGFIQDGNYAAASGGMLASKWASQVGARATRLANMMKTGATP